MAKGDDTDPLLRSSFELRLNIWLVAVLAALLLPKCMHALDTTYIMPGIE